MTPFTSEKFATLTEKRQHKHAARLLRHAIEENASFELYNAIASTFDLPPPKGMQEACERFHFHSEMAGLSLSESELLRVRKADREDGAPFLDVDIYLDNLRSAHNVGSIIRTCEAFRIGEIYLGGNTPSHRKEKIQKTSMGADSFVTCHAGATLKSLTKRPLIAIETVEGAMPLSQFSFPDSFSLLVGNEELGLSNEALAAADHILQIPLCGAKNSLNVAICFGIVCAFIRREAKGKTGNLR